MKKFIILIITLFVYLNSNATQKMNNEEENFNYFIIRFEGKNKEEIEKFNKLFAAKPVEGNPYTKAPGTKVGFSELEILPMFFALLNNCKANKDIILFADNKIFQNIKMPIYLRVYLVEQPNIGMLNFTWLSLKKLVNDKSNGGLLRKDIPDILKYEKWYKEYQIIVEIEFGYEYTITFDDKDNNKLSVKIESIRTKLKNITRMKIRENLQQQIPLPILETVVEYVY